MTKFFIHRFSELQEKNKVFNIQGEQSVAFCCTFAPLKQTNYQLIKTLTEMKKVLFVLAVAGFFAACGGNTETATETATETPETEVTTETPAETVTETPVAE